MVLMNNFPLVCYNLKPNARSCFQKKVIRNELRGEKAGIRLKGTYGKL